MQNMLNSANSCGVYSLILELNILVAGWFIFFHLCFSSPIPHPISTHLPLHDFLWEYEFNILSSTSMMLPDNHFTGFPLGKVGGGLKECFWIAWCCTGSTLGNLLGPALTPAPHTAQTLCRPDSIKAGHCQESASPVVSGLPAKRIPEITELSFVKCVLRFCKIKALMNENKHMVSWAKKGKEDLRDVKNKRLFLPDFDSLKD